MKTLDPGHLYSLDYLDGEGEPFGILRFVKREGEKYPGNVGHHSGTTTQEVLRACLDRIAYVHQQNPCDENVIIMNMLSLCIWQLETRAARLHGRTLPYGAFEDAITGKGKCTVCGHVCCEGQCRK